MRNIWTRSLASMIKKLFNAPAISVGFVGSTPLTTMQSTPPDF
jgi:hypothetical protein